MASPIRQPDLFRAPQPDLFEALPQTPGPADYERMARARLQGYLAKARAASRMPWPQRDADGIEEVYATMAYWLPQPERDAICEALRAEFERLRAAA